MAERVVKPEILDSLDASDPAAIRSRKDLRRINWFMRGETWILQQLASIENLSKVARLRGVDVLNLDDLSEALRPSVVVGEKFRLPLVRSGKDDHQAVGYLADGTMIVVNHAVDKIGSTQDVLVISTLQTSSGVMVFAEISGK